LNLKSKKENTEAEEKSIADEGEKEGNLEGEVET
jgi:hypothetical protein